MILSFSLKERHLSPLMLRAIRATRQKDKINYSLWHLLIFHEIGRFIIYNLNIQNLSFYRPENPANPIKSPE